MGIAHLDEVQSAERNIGHLRARWTLLGEAAGSVGVGVRRIQMTAGGWSSPVHDHGGGEELFYVVAGRGISWHDGATAEIATGDCIVYRAGAGGHTLHCLDELDVLAFGPRHRDLSTRFPRLGLSMIGTRFAESVAAAPGAPLVQFAREGELGAPELPAAGPRPSTIVNVADVPVRRDDRPLVAVGSRNLGHAVGSVSTGLRHVEVVAGKASAPAHCHSLEEEIFVVLAGDGVLRLDDEETPVRAGHVVARPPATAVAHQFIAGPAGLTYLAYGTREAGDVCFYPRSGKFYIGGVGLIGRVERLDYWDGED